MSQKIKTVADLNALGWVSVRRIRAHPTSIKVLGRRRQLGFGRAFDRVDVLVLDLAIERPGQPRQLLEECRFQKKDALDRADLDQCRDRLMADIVKVTGFEDGSLSKSRNEWRSAWIEENAPDLFDDPGREALFQDLADRDDLLDRMHAAADPHTAEVASLLRRLFFRGGDTVRQDLQRRFEEAAEKGIAISAQRASAGAGRGRRLRQESDAWAGPCWRWACANLSCGWTYFQLIDFVLDNWDDRPFAPLGPKGKAAPPSSDTLRSQIPKWKQRWPEAMRLNGAVADDVTRD